MEIRVCKNHASSSADGEAARGTIRPFTGQTRVRLDGGGIVI